MTLRLGIDAGGTCTDAVLVDARGRVRASAKVATVHARPLESLRAAAGLALVRAGGAGGAADAARRVELVSLSTTLATNALVEGRGRPVGLVLIGLPPAGLHRAGLGAALAGDPVAFVGGGHDAAGEPLAALDREALADFARTAGPAVDAWAVSASFAVRNPAHELEAAAVLGASGALPVALGHELGEGLDAPRRALTALLNARLVGPIAALVDAAGELLAELGIEAPLVMVRGDGTVAAAELARARPVETILSGPAASVVGACALARVDDALVVDTGGTTSDLVRVEGGRPRLSPGGARVGGHRTTVRAIEVSSVGLGGDSEVRLADVAPAHRARDARTGETGADSIGGTVALGPVRVVPLSTLAGPEAPAAHRAATLGTLRRQLERGRATERDGRFVVRVDAGESGGGGGVEGGSGGELGRALAPGPARLLGHLGAAPVALEDLARASGLGAALDRPLGRLEALGLVRRAGFTPTDAMRVIDVNGGRRDGGRREGADEGGEAPGVGEADEAALLGGALLGREAGAKVAGRAAGATGPGGSALAAAVRIAEATRREMALRVALACADVALDDRESGAAGPVGPRRRGRAVGPSAEARRERLRWLGETLAASGESPWLALAPRLGVPLVGVGGPAHRHHPAAAALLGTRCVLPEHAAVANAVGAVAGAVRESRTVTLVPEGPGAVRVLLASGPVVVPDLETAARIATEAVGEAALEAARAAGAEAPVVSVRRDDALVEIGGASTLVESRVTAVAVGRPAGARR